MKMTRKEAFKLLEKYSDEPNSSKGREDFLAMVKKDLSEHVLTKVKDGVWHVGKPGTRILSYHVSELPEGMWVLCGDLGELMVQRGGFEWLKCCERSWDYFLSKSPGLKRGSEFCVGNAVEQLKEWLNDEDQDQEAVLRINATGMTVSQISTNRRRLGPPKRKTGRKSV